MTFFTFSSYLSQLEKTASRLKITEILSRLFGEVSADEIGKVCYLLQGRIAPIFANAEFGVSEKLAARVIGMAVEKSADEIIQEFKKNGDLGNVMEELKIKKEKLKITIKNLKITEVFEILEKVAWESGAGSVERKLQLLSSLLNQADPLSAKYIVRIILGKLRLGFSDMTVLDGLSWLIKGDKGYRVEIEKAYNVYPDLGFIAKKIKIKGIGGIKGIRPKVGVPILMARAERISSGKEIIAKIGECAVEPKFDGLRLQIHLSKNQKYFTRLFSRNLEDVTNMFPDIVEAIKKQIKAQEVIFEGEAVAYDPKTNKFLPFQETAQRKRKYDIGLFVQNVPMKLIAFDLLYLDGESLIDKGFLERRKKLEGIISLS